MLRYISLNLFVFFIVTLTTALGEQSPTKPKATIIQYQNGSQTQSQEIQYGKYKDYGIVSIPGDVNVKNPVTIHLVGIDKENLPIEASLQIYEPIGGKLTDKKIPLQVMYDKKIQKYHLVIPAKTLSPGRKYSIKIFLLSESKLDEVQQVGGLDLLVQNLSE